MISHDGTKEVLDMKVFCNKNVLKTNVAFYAIQNQFEFRSCISMNIYFHVQKMNANSHLGLQDWAKQTCSKLGRWARSHVYEVSSCLVS